MTGEVDFGINDRQLWFLWHLRERSAEELKAALKNAGELFKRLQSEMEESGIHTYPPGPWHAGLEPFPDCLGSLVQTSRGTHMGPARVVPSARPPMG